MKGMDKRQRRQGWMVLGIALAVAVAGAWAGETAEPAAAPAPPAPVAVKPEPKTKVAAEQAQEARRKEEGQRIAARVERLKREADAAAKALEESKKAPKEEKVFISNETSPSESKK